MRGLLHFLVVLGLAALPPLGPGLAQEPMGHEDTIAQPTPPPIPPRQPPDKDEVPEYEQLLQDSDAPWGLPADLLESLFGQAEVYSDYTSRFTCNETARLANYDGSGGFKAEKARVYGYLLIRDGFGVKEYRQKLGKDGTVKAGAVKDEEPFPPAYAWVFLFSRFNEPYFSYRSLGDRFDGFDWVHEIEFRGSLPFTDGKDIRQWEGTVLVDAVTFTPIEIRAEPAGQRARIDALYRRWNSSFNIMGFRTNPKPMGYRAAIQFRYRKDGLTFPTELRYDTFQAVSTTQVTPSSASTRSYAGYQIYRTEATPELGVQVENQPPSE